METPKLSERSAEHAVAGDRCSVPRHLDALSQIVLAVNRAGDFSSAVEEVLFSTIDLLGFDGGGVYMIDDDGEHASVHYHHFLPSDFVDEVGTIAIEALPYNSVFLDKEPLFIEHYEQLRPDKATQWGFKSVASVPMLHDGLVVGALNVISRQRHTFSDAEKTLLTNAGYELGFALAREKLYQQLRNNEASLHEFMECARDMFFVIGKDGRIIYANPVVMQALGYRGDEVLQMNVLDLHPVDSRDAAMTIVASMIAGTSTTCSLPLLAKDGRRVPVETRVSSGVWHGREVLFGVSRDSSHDKLVKAVIETIRGISQTLDPYTADHEARVAKVCEETCEHLDLVAAARCTLLVAAAVHDIGKIAIPAAILCKPSRLTSEELALVKTHPSVGSRLLTPIVGLGPVAAIVGQHHERMDGSGYPNGLFGDEILPEARILAVADVVEAMSSHRPYRPAIGLDVAISEINRLRGTALDPAAVDACTKAYEASDLAFLEA